jgi:hypothetical protein
VSLLQRGPLPDFWRARTDNDTGGRASAWDPRARALAGTRWRSVADSFQPREMRVVRRDETAALPIINVANCCCAWILFGGALAAYLMQQPHPTPISAGDGAIVGLMAGAVGAVVWLMLEIPLSLVLGPIQARLLEQAMQSTSDLSPEIRAWLEGMRSGAGRGVTIVIGFLVMLFVGSLFAMLGGIAGALLFRKSGPPAGVPAQGDPG